MALVGVSLLPSRSLTVDSHAAPVWQSAKSAFAFNARRSKLANGRPFLTAEPGGTPDGFRVDVDGNLWCGWGMGNERQDGVRVIDPNGTPIGFIALPERCANVCFGGVKRNRLFMTASHSVYSLYVNTQGAPGG